MENRSGAKKTGEELLSLAEGAKKYGVSHSYLRLLIFKKKLRAVKLGRNWVTKKEWLDEALLPASDTGTGTAGVDLSLAQAAKIYGVSHNYLRFLIFKKKLKAVRVGRNWATSRQWLDEFFSVPKANVSGAKVVLGAAEVGPENKEQIDFSTAQDFQKSPVAVSVQKPAARPNIFSQILPNIVWNSSLVLSTLIVFLFLGLFVSNFFQQSQLSNLDFSRPQYLLGDLILGGAPALNNLKNNLKTAFQNSWFKSKDDLKNFAAAAGEQTGLLQNLSQKVFSFSQFISDSLYQVVFGVQKTEERESALAPGPEIASSAEVPGVLGAASPSPGLTPEKQIVQVREIIERQETFVPADLTSVKSELLLDVQTLNSSLRDYFTRALEDLRSSLSRTSGRTESAMQMITLTQKIDTLDSIQITNGANIISGGIDITKGNIFITEGGITADNLTSRGSLVSQAGTSTLVNLSISGNSTLGDNLADTTFFNTGTLTFNNRATTTIPTNTLNAFSYATTTSGIPFLTFDTSNYRLGIGTTSPSSTFSIGGAGNLYALGGLGVGVATTTQGNLQVSGDIQVQNLTINGTCTGCGTATGWTDDGTVVRLITVTDLVGIGTTTPRSVLGLAGAAPSIFLTDTNLSASLGGRSFFLLHSNGDFSIGTTSNLFNATSTYFTIASTSRIGIGTTSPASLFSVQGNTLVSGTTTAGGFEATSTVRSKHVVISGTLNVESGGAIVGAGAAGKVTNLDADLLDGQDSSAFGDATAANQTTILNRIGQATDATSTSPTAPASLFAGLKGVFGVIGSSTDATTTYPTAPASLFAGLKGLSRKASKSEEFTASGTFTPTGGTTLVWVTVVGGGGGGGGGGDSNSGTGKAGGGGGGGGSGALIYRLPVIATTSITVTIGAGGAGGGTGSAGATTTFGSIDAGGGNGGSSGSSGGGSDGAGGSGGTGGNQGVFQGAFGGGANSAGGSATTTNFVSGAGGSGGGGGGTIAVGGAGGASVHRYGGAAGSRSSGSGSGGGGGASWAAVGGVGANANNTTDGVGSPGSAGSRGSGGGGGSGATDIHLHGHAGGSGGAGGAGYVLVEWVE